MFILCSVFPKGRAQSLYTCLDNDNEPVSICAAQNVQVCVGMSAPDFVGLVLKFPQMCVRMCV